MRGRTSAPHVCVRHSGLMKHTNFPATITSSFIMSCCITTYLPILARHHLIPATFMKPPPLSSNSAVFCFGLEFCEFLPLDPLLYYYYLLCFQITILSNIELTLLFCLEITVLLCFEMPILFCFDITLLLCFDIPISLCIVMFWDDFIIMFWDNYIVMFCYVVR